MLCIPKQSLGTTLPPILGTPRTRHRLTNPNIHPGNHLDPIPARAPLLITIQPLDAALGPQRAELDGAVVRGKRGQDGGALAGGAGAGARVVGARGRRGGRVQAGEPQGEQGAERGEAGADEGDVGFCDGEDGGGGVVV